MTSSDDDMEDLSVTGLPFATERLQCLSEGSVEKLIGDESVNLEEILYGSIGVGEDGGCKEQSVCPKMTLGGDVDSDYRKFFPGRGS